MDAVFEFDLPASGDGSCLLCGEGSFAAIVEVWGHEFQIDACCGARRLMIEEEIGEGGRAGAAALRNMGFEELVGPLRGVDADGPSLEVDYRLAIRPIGFGPAKAFVLAHHHHCRPPAGWRFGAACWNGPTLVGVAMVGRPVARMIDAARVVEVNRLCIDKSASPALRRNAASMLLGHAAKEARRRGFERIITYTLASEEGVSLRAAGWVEDGRSAGGSWSRPSRSRGPSGPTDPKVRWVRDLVRRGGRRRAP